MLRSGSHSKIISTIVLIVGLLTIWIAFAPTNLGGQVAYVLINGNSMEPGFHDGDLALVRKASSYQVGDIVTYRDNEMQAYVIHRIVGQVQDRFVMKGDNNSWIDGTKPTADEIVGKLWLHIPKMGEAAEWVRVPLHAALAVVLLGGLLMVSTMVENNQNKKKKNGTQNSIGLFQLAVYACCILAVAFLALTLYSLSQPLQKLASAITYKQTGVFTYTAAGNTGVYDSGSAQSGEPIFTKLTCNLNLGFNYSLTGDQVTGVSGYQQYYAKVIDQESGWQRIIPMTNAVNFDGTTTSNTTSFNLCEVQSLVSAMETDTGFRLSNTYRLDIISRISLKGNIDGQGFNSLFEPKISFQFDSLHFYLISTDATQPDPLTTTQTSSIPNMLMVENTVKLFGLPFTVRGLRSVGEIGLEVALFSLFDLGLYFYFISKHNPERMIRIKYSGLLIDVKDRAVETFSPVINVASIDDLAKLAERGNVMIIHLAAREAHSSHYYLVQVDGTNYCYQTGKSATN
jgi:signal peptidase I, bacterial type/signal peptidase I, archaeal type